MKILIANPPYRVPLGRGRERFFIRSGSRWPFSIVKRISQLPDYVPFPFYLAYAAAALEGKPGMEIFVEDGVARNGTETDLLERIAGIRPDLLLFETAANTLRYDLSLCRKIKELSPDTRIALAGFHVTALPEETLRLFGSAVDFLLLAEYELTFAALAEAIRDGRECAGLSGLAFRRNGEIVIHRPAEVTDVSRLPHPARHLFPSDRQASAAPYWDGFCQKRPAVQLHASRGCPFRCNFCVWNQLMYRNGRYRPFAPGFVCDEIEAAIRDQGAREIYFDDDTFTGSKEHVLAFCEEMAKRGLDKRISWSAMADFMITDPEMLERMADAGCIGLKFGVESGSQEILRHIGKPIDFARVRRNAGLCAKLGIKTHATFTFGLSNETRRTMDETLALAESLDCDSVQFSITTPFPGTRYYEELKAQGRLKSEDWEAFDGNRDCVTAFEDFDEAYIVGFQRRAAGRWLRRKLRDPRWVKRQMILSAKAFRWQGWGYLRPRIARLFELLIG